MDYHASFDKHELFSVDGLVAVVTGGGTGLGSVIARALASNGAMVYILGRRLEKLQSVAAAAAAAGSKGQIKAIECDVTDKTSLENAANIIAAETGYINLLVANAGVPGPQDTSLNRSVDDIKAPLTLDEVQAHLWRTPTNELSETFKINVIAVHFTAVAFLNLLNKGNEKNNVKQTSQIVFTSSIAAFHRSWTACSIAYTTSKAAVTHLLKNLAAVLIQFRIRVNGIVPGLFLSEITAPLFNGHDMTVEGSLPRAIQPMRRIGTDNELAGTVLYLASEAGGYCAGSLQLIDGGRLGGLPGATW